MEYHAWAKSIRDYANWLVRQCPDTAHLWEGHLNSSDDAQVEGAVGEAVSWDFLYNRVDRIALYQSPGTGGPDFVCEQAGTRFVVEATNLSTSKVSERTNLRPERSGATFYGTMSRQLISEIKNKARQGAGLTDPYVVFATTLHFDASVLCVQKAHVEELLVGKTGIACDIDMSVGDAIGDPYQTASFNQTAFTRNDSLDDARRNVSGLIVGGFGLRPPDAHVLGVLHPNAVRPFNPALLPDIPFARRVLDWSKGTVAIEWTDNGGEESSSQCD